MRVAPAVAAFVLTSGLCLGAGRPLLMTAAYEADVFDADAKRVVHDLARHDGTHYRTKVHPLFVLFLNPLGLALKALVVRPRPAALVLNAAAAGAGAALLFLLLQRLGVAAPRALLWTGLFATSTTQLFFGLLPESYSFSAAALLLLFVAFAAGARLPARLAAALLAFAMTVTNLAAGPLLAALPEVPGGRPRPGRGLAFAALLVLLAVPLSLLQRQLYPGADVFFLPSSVAEEENYLFRPASLAELAQRGRDLAGTALVVNLAAPSLVTSQRAGEPPVTRFGPLRPAGRVHAVLWVAFCVLAVAGLVRGAAWRQPLLLGLAGWLLFNAALHFVYGETLFLYSAHWTFAVVALVAVGAEWTAARRRRLVPAAIGLLIGLQLLTNAAFVRDLYRIYR